MTSTVSLSSPTSIVNGIRLALPTWTGMLLRSTVPKPDSSAFRS